MIIVVKTLIELFRSMKREKELNRKILVFFISHNHIVARIYDHYSMIEENKIIFYRHSIRKFNFTDDKEK